MNFKKDFFYFFNTTIYFLNFFFFTFLLYIYFLNLSSLFWKKIYFFCFFYSLYKSISVYSVSISLRISLNFMLSITSPPFLFSVYILHQKTKKVNYNSITILLQLYYNFVEYITINWIILQNQKIVRYFWNFKNGCSWSGYC